MHSPVPEPELCLALAGPMDKGEREGKKKREEENKKKN
jgi:hypothetical protein